MGGATNEIQTTVIELRQALREQLNDSLEGRVVCEVRSRGEAEARLQLAAFLREFDLEPVAHDLLELSRETALHVAATV